MSKQRILLRLTCLVFAVLLLMAFQAQAAGTLYLVDEGGNSFYTVNTGTAATTLVGAGDCDALALSPFPSIFLYCAVSGVTTGTLYQLALDGSGLTLLTTIFGDADRGLAYNTSTSLLYGTDNSVFGSINPGTGAFTALAAPPEEAESLAADPNNNLIYGLGTNNNLIVFNVIAGSWSTVGPTGVIGSKAGLAFDPTSNTIYAIETQGDLYSINPATASATFIGNAGIDSNVGLTFAPLEVVVTEAVPTMTEWGMFIFIVLAGLGAFYYLRRKRAES